MKKLHYEASGDNYKIKDPFKILALKYAKKTAANLSRFSKYGLTISEPIHTRGESAYRVNIRFSKSVQFEVVHLEEGLGTKNVIADALGDKFYEFVAIDNVASIFNDLATTGAAALSFMLHIAAYPTEWFTSRRAEAVLRGTAYACNLAGASWGGGESATMRDIIMPSRSLLSGSATGIIVPSSKALSEEKIAHGDRIILLASSGVHTNGITLLRKEFLTRLPKGYKTKLSDGTTFGDALMKPSIIYSRFIEDVVHSIDVHYGIHITGHGWRKIMRSDRKLTYLIENMPTPQSIFNLIQKCSGASDRDMYDSYNMGAGFALFVPEKSVPQIQELAKKTKIKAMDAGYVQAGKRQVVIKPLDITLEGSSLKIR